MDLNGFSVGEKLLFSLRSRSSCEQRKRKRDEEEDEKDEEADE